MISCIAAILCSPSAEFRKQDYHHSIAITLILQVLMDRAKRLRFLSAMLSVSSQYGGGSYYGLLWNTRPCVKLESAVILSELLTFGS